MDARAHWGRDPPAPTRIEQSFVFATLPAGDDLVVRIAVTTELSARQAAEGFEFGNELGHVAFPILRHQAPPAAMQRRPSGG